ncbi:hypothetical protein FB451DRAFT_1164561 [Mycena latifolia]|nr:hypothetical protein FB451DRAFT_1164561 [Mycena latifolia]
MESGIIPLWRINAIRGVWGSYKVAGPFQEIRLHCRDYLPFYSAGAADTHTWYMTIKWPSNLEEILLAPPTSPQKEEARADGERVVHPKDRIDTAVVCHVEEVRKLEDVHGGSTPSNAAAAAVPTQALAQARARPGQALPEGLGFGLKTSSRRGPRVALRSLGMRRTQRSRHWDKGRRWRWRTPERWAACFPTDYHAGGCAESADGVSGVAEGSR